MFGDWECQLIVRDRCFIETAKNDHFNDGDKKCISDNWTHTIGGWYLKGDIFKNSLSEGHADSGSKQ